MAPRTFRVDYALGADGLSILMLILNALLSFLAVIGSWNIQPRQRFYMALLLFLETGVAGVFASYDLFLFIFFWEVELIPMFLLIGIWGGARREYAAWKFLLYTLIGSVFTLGGIFLIYFQTGGKSANFQHLSVAGPQITGTIPFFGASLSLPVVIFILICRRLRGEDADVAGAYLAARRPHRGADGGERPAGGHAAEDGRVRPDSHRLRLLATGTGAYRALAGHHRARSAYSGARALRWSRKT